MKKVFIIHGWGGYRGGWFLWLKAELEKAGFAVEIPLMSESDEPKIEEWVGRLAEVVGQVSEETFFVGHSIGSQTILRYLERLPSGQKVGGVAFVAPWFTLSNLASEEIAIAAPWINTKIDFQKVKQHCENFFAVFSDDDPLVPLENQQLFVGHLDARTILEHNKGHYGGDDNIQKIPAILAAILEM